MSVVDAPFQPYGEGVGVLPCECVEDQGPGRESVLTPPLKSRQALVGTAAHAVGYPLGQRVIVWWRPSAVVLEPSVLRTAVSASTAKVSRPPRPAPVPVSRRVLCEVLLSRPSWRVVLRGRSCW